LEQLERRASFLVELSDFAIKNGTFDRQLSQGVNKLWIIKRLFIARDQAHIFAVLERQCPVAVMLDFVEPIAFR